MAELIKAEELFDTGGIRVTVEFSIDADMAELMTAEGNAEFCQRAQQMLEEKLDKLRRLAPQPQGVIEPPAK